MSAIEWTDETWNPTVGCSKVSPGCDNCYAERVASRGLNPAHRQVAAFGKWNGKVLCLPERLDTPLRWRKPRRVFVDSMSDLFHPSVPDAFIARVFQTMSSYEVLRRGHTFQILTKRPRRMAEWLSRVRPSEGGWYTLDGVEPMPPDNDEGIVINHRAGWPLPNVWLGTSVEDQHQADRRIPHLLATPAAVRFLSCEPLLGPIDLQTISYVDGDRDMHVDALSREAWVNNSDSPAAYCNESDGVTGIDWCIVGGESGPGARPMHPEWARSLRDQCQAASVPFFFKQWGEWTDRRVGIPCGTTATDLDGAHLYRVGKKAAGRELDGRTWDEYPERAGVAA